VNITPETLRKLAGEYLAADDATDPNPWEHLGLWVTDQAEYTGRFLDVIQVACDNPYRDAGAQADDIATNGRFLVSTTNCEHPILTPAQNVALRTYHDIDGHYAHDLSFSPADECELWARTVADVPLATRDAWTCEFLYQTAYVATTGHYLQRCVNLGPIAASMLRDALRR